eukprot:4047438-Pyramimonas_sp.AAC.1
MKQFNIGYGKRSCYIDNSLEKAQANFDRNYNRAVTQLRRNVYMPRRFPRAFGSNKSCNSRMHCTYTLYMPRNLPRAFGSYIRAL